jgi:hypothetical protein
MICRGGYSALPALSHALANHIAYCDAQAFGERLRELCEEEHERHTKSPGFEIVRANVREETEDGAEPEASASALTASLSRVTQGAFDLKRFLGDDDGDGETKDDIAIGRAFVEYGTEGARRDATGMGSGADEAFGVAAFHCCGCAGVEFAPARHPKYKCGEIASLPVSCQQCGTVYDKAHAEILRMRAKGDEWCACGSSREPTGVILALKEDLERFVSAEALEQSRKRCDDALAANIVALDLEKSLQETLAVGSSPDVEETDAREDDASGTGGATVSTNERTVTIDFTNFLHYGVGCDLCGEYPIMGKRFQCVECAASEFMGFDLCGKCMDSVEKSDRKREYRFAQNHTDEHNMRLVKPRPTMIHVMQALHPELSPQQIMQWLERQHAATAEAEEADGPARTDAQPGTRAANASHAAGAAFDEEDDDSDWGDDESDFYTSSSSDEARRQRRRRNDEESNSEDEIPVVHMPLIEVFDGHYDSDGNRVDGEGSDSDGDIPDGYFGNVDPAFLEARWAELSDGLEDEYSDSDDLPDNVSDGVPDDASDGVPDDASDGVSDDISDGVPDDISDGVPDDASDGVPDDISDGVPDDISDGVPDDISDGVPDEDDFDDASGDIDDAADDFDDDFGDDFADDDFGDDFADDDFDDNDDYGDVDDYDDDYDDEY